MNDDNDDDDDVADDVDADDDDQLSVGTYSAECCKVDIRSNISSAHWPDMYHDTRLEHVHSIVCNNTVTTVGGVALWLERRSMTGELSKAYALACG